jgi:WD40 repeat protein
MRTLSQTLCLAILSALLAGTQASAQTDKKPPALPEVKFAKNLAFAPDGSFVLIDYRRAANPTPKNVGLGVWDTKTGEFRVGMEKSTHQWDSIALSADGKKAAGIYMQARELKVWDTGTGKLVDEQKLPEKKSGFTPLFLEFSQDGAVLYSTLDKQILEAKLGGKNRLRDETLDIQSRHLLAFNPKTRQLLLIRNIMGRPKAELLIYNLGKESKPQTVDLSGHVASMAISHDGKTLAMSYPRQSGKPRFELWDADGWKLRTTLPADKRKGFSHYAMLAFAPNDKSLAGAPVYDPRTDKDVDFLDLEGKVHHEFTNTTFVDSLTFSPDGKTLAVKLLDFKDSLLFVDPATGKTMKP